MKILTNVILSSNDIIKKYTCIWDTGASETLISNKVINELNPVKDGHTYIKTIHGEKKVDKYTLNLLLDKHTKYIKINSACFGNYTEFDVIIGMDIINYGKIILDKGAFSFTIDFLL